ncbi:MAG: FG-GAP-like repeat-containing protein, partial [Pseudomonadota bacterium]
AAPLPSGASYDGMSGELRFRPAEAQVADFPVTFAVTDGKAMDTEAVTLSVQMPMGEVTTITGRVLDTTDFTADGTERAVEGAVVSILDSGVSDTTGPDGRFTLANVPSGLVLLDIATATANLAPDGAPYAGFREAISLIPDVINEFDRPFFLPRVAAEGLTTVDPNSTTVVRNDTLGIRIEIPPNTAKSPDGSDYTGEMSISLVPDAVAPAALPEELGFGTLITIQPVGVYFDEPVPIFFPNTDGLPNGVEVDIWSLDPSLGQFAVVGQGQVNGNEIRTISGGVIAADWHGPLARLTGLEVPEDKDCDYCSKFRLLARLAPDVISGELPYDAELVSYRTDNGRTAYDIRYNSTAASGLTTLVSTSDVPRSAPASVQSQVRVGGVSGATSTGSSTANKAYGKGLPGPGEEFRTAGQIDFATLPTGLHEYEYRLTGRFQSSGVTATRTGRVPLVNRMSSDFGAGWGLLGHERLHFAEDGSAVLVDGNASSFVYRAQRAGTGRFGGQIALNIFPVNFPKGHSDPVVADFDGSGNLDIAVANTGFSSSVNTDEHITVFLGDGTGEFSQIRFDTGPGNIPSNMAGGFFDAGPTHDLVTVGNRVDLHLNNGDGTFQTPLSITGTGIRNAREVLVADFNKDGRSDIAYPNHNNTYVNPDTNYDVVLSDTGAGWLPPLTLSVGSNTRDGISGDFNGDTNPDLAVVFIGDASSSVGVYFGDGSGGFGPPTYYNPTDRPVDIESGDINRDGHADLVLLDTSTDTVVTMVNDGSGGFSQFNSEMLGLGNSFRIEVADLDADTHPDVLVSLQGSNAAISLMNNGSGGFPETFNPFTVPVAGGLAVGEFTGDSALDLVVVGRQSGADHLAVVPGEGNGNFFPFQTVLTLGGNNAEEEFVKADFNDDGVTDLAIVNRTSIDMYLNTGSGFDRTRFNTVGTVGELAGGDFDGDGDVDLIRGTDPSSANVALYLNDGGGDLLSTRVNVP